MSEQYVPDGEAEGVEATISGVEDNRDAEPVAEPSVDSTAPGDGTDGPTEEPGTGEAGSVGDALPTEGLEAEESLVEQKTPEELLAERTEDLQRLQAEYVNYKRRVDRDRASARSGGIEAVMLDLLPTLDAIALARQAEELTGGPKLIADELEKVTAKYGVVSYGEVGDAFDPQLHDALMAVPGEPGQTEALCGQVLQRGWKIGERIVRHARVAVSEPTA